MKGHAVPEEMRREEHDLDVSLVRLIRYCAPIGDDERGQSVGGECARSVEVRIDDVGVAVLFVVVDKDEAVFGRSERVIDVLGVQVDERHIFIRFYSKTGCEERMAEELVCPEVQDAVGIDEIGRSGESMVQVPAEEWSA